GLNIPIPFVGAELLPNGVGSKEITITKSFDIPRNPLSPAGVKEAIELEVQVPNDIELERVSRTINSAQKFPSIEAEGSEAFANIGLDLDGVLGLIPGPIGSLFSAVGQEIEFGPFELEYDVLDLSPSIGLALGETVVFEPTMFESTLSVDGLAPQVFRTLDSFSKFELVAPENGKDTVSGEIKYELFGKVESSTDIRPVITGEATFLKGEFELELPGSLPDFEKEFEELSAFEISFAPDIGLSFGKTVSEEVSLGNVVLPFQIPIENQLPAP
ncbi:MAG: hypothetical protein ABG776_07870, partial [Cyanobacteria bacterium J06555_13]